MTMSEVLMWVVAKAAEPTGTTVTLASDQGDVMSIRFMVNDHLSDLYEVGYETMVTIEPVLYPVRFVPPAITCGGAALPAAPADARS